MSDNTLFSPDWADLWAQRLNGSDRYRVAAAKWRWPVIVRVDEGPAWHLDLYEGRCRSIRPATESDEADYEIAASASSWQEVLSGHDSPLVAIMQGSLRLERGSKVRLTRFTSAAKEMLASAAVASAELAGSGQAADPPGGDGHAVAFAPVAAPEPVPAASAQPGRVGPSPGGNDHQAFRTTAAGGLDFDSFPMQLYAKAKKLGIWDPAEIDFSQDVADWQELADDEQDLLLRLIAMFQAGEEAVTLDLIPLIRVIASEGRLEEELYLTTFLFEEAKHTEFFRRFLDSVPGALGDLGRYHSSAYRTLFYQDLPRALGNLDTDASPEAQLNAAATYNMIVEGTLAETGYHALYEVLDRRGILNGLRTGVGLLQRDESRHIAYGVHLITRLVEGSPSMYRAFQARMDALLPTATEVISEMFAAYDPMPFGLLEEDFLQYAMDQFGKRVRRIRGEPVE